VGCNDLVGEATATVDDLLRARAIGELMLTAFAKLIELIAGGRASSSSRRREPRDLIPASD
jgi:hypothetical protein